METLKLATAALLAALAAIPAPAWAKPPTSLCRAPEPVLFTCHVGTKLVSICGQEQGGAAYRYGQPGRLELEITDLHRGHKYESGGGETQVYANTPTHRYVVYDRIVRTGFGADGLHYPREDDGLLVQSKERTVWRRQCALPRTYDPHMIPEGRFDQQLIEKLIPEGEYVDH